ncbi:uncharacterized protein LOC110838300 isoform X2 [Zootermopsis nevadensis]|nr:uncharacterized protein LOC110838300 isoform X2 [Zootermopsis nevadensis]
MINSAHMRESLGPTARGSYLKSEDISESPKVEEPMKKLHRLRLLSDDPRSPSSGILRTPIQVESTPEDVYYKSDEEESSPADCLFTDTSLEDLVLHPSINSGNKPRFSLLDPGLPSEESAHTQNQLDDPSHSLNHQTADACVTSQSGDLESNCNAEDPGDVRETQLNCRKPVVGTMTPMKSNKTNEDCLIRKLFNDPDSKEHLMQASPKARTPLQTVSANGITPQQILRVKQSRGINQEIGRLSGIENTPPDTLNIRGTLTKNKQPQKYNMSSSWEPENTIIL